MSKKRRVKKIEGTRRDTIKLTFVRFWRMAPFILSCPAYKSFVEKRYCRPIMLWRACELLWRRKSYTDRLYALTPDHINFHKDFCVDK